MIFPLDAFQYTAGASVAPGTVVADERGNWYLVARKSGETSNQFVRLSRGANGAEPGDLLASTERVFAVAAPYTTSIRVPNLFGLHHGSDGPYHGTLMLAEPVAIFTYGSDRRLIGLNGHEIDENTLHSRRARFMKWSVWLLDAHGREVGDGPLVEIDATEQ